MLFGKSALFISQVFWEFIICYLLNLKLKYNKWIIIIQMNFKNKMSKTSIMKVLINEMIAILKMILIYKNNKSLLLLICIIKINIRWIKITNNSILIMKVLNHRIWALNNNKSKNLMFKFNKILLHLLNQFKIDWFYKDF